jgi:hypothetical protein
LFVLFGIGEREEEEKEEGVLLLRSNAVIGCKLAARNNKRVGNFD